jgi:membrane protein DedA with SNARE-associated domain/rhodanese-related sulfurtransferase
MEPLGMITRWGIALVFGSVLLEHGGLPVPAAPILLGAGALAQQDVLRAEYVLLAAFAACLAADHFWFLLGRRLGRRLLAGVCRLSLSPDTCVRKTDDLIMRHGTPLLLVAKFIPGVSAVAIPTVAAMGLSYRRFLLFDSLGSLLWCGTYVGAGMIFSREVNRVLEAMSRIGGWSLVIVGALFALYIFWKVAHRMQLRNLYRSVRIEPDEMAELIDANGDLLILDARSGLARAADPRTLPGSMQFDHDDQLDRLPADARDRTIITFCTCPNEASAALLAQKLIRAGYARVRVLAGGEKALAELMRRHRPELS